MKHLCLDCETNGVDRHHGARPFMVQAHKSLDEPGMYWEWEVEPRSREVRTRKEDLEEIAHEVETADRIVFQNAKFDVGMILPELKPFIRSWPWEKTVDTLYASHLLCSNPPHDLTSLALMYLSKDIDHLDKRCKEVVTRIRAMVDQDHSPIGDWRIAKQGLPEMPSAPENPWKYDLWLPAALRREFPELISEEDASCTIDYATTDPAATLGIWFNMLEEMQARNLLTLFEDRMRLMPIIWEVENNGVTGNYGRLNEMVERFSQEAAAQEQTCLKIAGSYDYELKMPKGSANNKSLLTFVFDVMQLPVVEYTDKGAPSLNKVALEEYSITLSPRSKQFKFIDSLAGRRKRTTALNYMKGYKAFACEPKDVKKEERDEWFRLYPSLNATGTHTLRFSSSNPNEQNISKQEGFNIRYAFGPLPGREWWSLDAKNIELRIPAYESGEALLIGLFEEPDKPPYYGSTHLLNFSTVYPDLWAEMLEKVGIEKVGPACRGRYKASWYQFCKNGGFAVQYGAVDKEDGTGTADKAFHKPGAHKLLKERFSKLEKLNRRYIMMAEAKGYVETLPDRSVDPDRGYPLMCRYGSYGGVKPTIPLNYHVQGSAMWWMCRAMIRAMAELRRLNREIIEKLHRLGARLIMQVHDELVFDFPAGEGPEPWKTNLPYIECLAREMEKGGYDIGVPTPVGIEYHPHNWAEGVTLK